MGRAHGDRDAGALASLGGVEGVVDEVAEEGDQVAGRQQALLDVAVVGEDQLHAAFVGLGRLAQEEGGQDRFGDRADHAVREGLGQFELRRGEVDGLLGAVELDQGDDGVEAVGCFVRLGAQGLGEVAFGVQLTAERLEFGVIAEGDDRAALLSAAYGAGVDDHDPVRGQVQLVDARLGGEERAGERGGQSEVGGAAADGVRTQAEEFAAAVVDEGDPAAAVEHEEAFAYGVQGCLVVVVHPAQLGGVHAVGVAAQTGVDDVRTEPAQCESAAREPEQHSHLLPDLRVDPLDGDARTDQAGDAGAVVDGGDDADRRAQGAGVRLGVRLAAQGGADVAEVAGADLVRIGVGPADAVPVHDRDEGDARGLADGFGVPLESGSGVRTERRLLHRGRQRDRLRDRRRLAAGRVLGLAVVGDVREESAARDEHRHQHDLHREELARQGAGSGAGDGYAHGESVPGGKAVNEMHGRVTGVTGRWIVAGIHRDVEQWTRGRATWPPPGGTVRTICIWP